MDRLYYTRHNHGTNKVFVFKNISIRYFYTTRDYWFFYICDEITDFFTSVLFHVKRSWLYCEIKKQIDFIADVKNNWAFFSWHFLNKEWPPRRYTMRFKDGKRFYYADYIDPTANYFKPFFDKSMGVMINSVADIDAIQKSGKVYGTQDEIARETRKQALYRKQEDWARTRKIIERKMQDHWNQGKSHEREVASQIRNGYTFPQ